jgi:hypothetical protein
MGLPPSSRALVSSSLRTSERLRKPATQRTGRVAGSPRPAPETSIDSSLRLPRQPREKQRQHEENDTDGDNTGDQHSELPSVDGARTSVAPSRVLTRSRARQRPSAWREELAASLDQATWRYWREAPAPDCSQRFTGTSATTATRSRAAGVSCRRTGRPGRATSISTMRGRPSHSRVMTTPAFSGRCQEQSVFRAQ